jgi:hypothetical protein
MTAEDGETAMATTHLFTPLFAACLSHPPLVTFLCCTHAVSHDAVTCGGQMGAGVQPNVRLSYYGKSSSQQGLIMGKHMGAKTLFPWGLFHACKGG